MIKLLSRNKKAQPITRAMKSRQASRKVSRQPIEIEWRKHLVFISAAVLFVIFATYVYSKNDLLPIQKIRITGKFTHLDTALIEAQLQPYLGTGFFSVDINRIQKELGTQAWIRNVSVRRVWPDQLSVAIVEQHAIARWDKSHLLSSTARVFEADSSGFTHLPVIHGYEGQSAELLSRFRRLQQTFQKYSLEISELHEDNKGALNLVLNNSLEISLGSVDNEEKINSFLAVYREQVKPRIEHIRHIDFRYSNGFAIAWKKEYLKKLGELHTRGNRNV